MSWVAIYFSIGWLIIAVGAFESWRRDEVLKWRVALVLFLIWPYIVPRGLYMARKQWRENNGR